MIKTIAVGNGPVGIAFNPNNGDMYVTNFGSNTVSVIDTTTNTVVATITVGSAPQFIAFNPNNGHMYVTNRGSNNVSVIGPTPTPPPQITITSAIDGNNNPVANLSSTSSNQITFQFTASGGTPPIRFECSLDNSAFSSCSNPVTYTNLAVGQHTAQFRATDSTALQAPSVAFTWQVTANTP
ncbi:MAG TPA: YncE family protein, partial [Nitrososphaeraceae archaeon]